MLVEFMIAQACTGMPSLDLQACSKALEATAVQYQVKQDVDNAEKVTTQIIYKKVSDVTGEKTLGVTLAVIKIVRDKSVSYPVIRRQDGIIPSVASTLDQHNGKIELKWNF